MQKKKGISLIVLVITIIVMVILAGAIILTLNNSGIINKASEAINITNEATVQEFAQTKWAEAYLETDKSQESLKEYVLDELQKAGITTKQYTIRVTTTGVSVSSKFDEDVTIAVAQLDTMLDSTTNSVTYDMYGNKMVIPAGFKVLVDDTTIYTAEDINVTKGIVIQDRTGNEFVWIPVGETIYESEASYKSITLGRYLGKNIKQPADGNTYLDEVAISDYYIEYQSTTTTANAKATNIKEFYESSIKNGGYYIGRFEAGKLNGALVCKANQTVYDYVTQSTAASLSKGMYPDNYSTGTFSSDLINSYAWDTALIFIQTFSTEEGADKYASSNKCTGYRKTGLNPDKYCNIYDLSGNADEWTTETYKRENTDSFSYENYSCCIRGGFYSTGLYGRVSNASTRSWSSDKPVNDGKWSFRPVLYVAY